MLGLSIVLLFIAYQTAAKPCFGFLMSLLFLFPIAERIRNMGWSPWWCLLSLIPIINLFVGVACLACPEGYAQSRKLDMPGKIVACAIALVFVVIAVVSIAAFLETA